MKMIKKIVSVMLCVAMTAMLLGTVAASNYEITNSDEWHAEDNFTVITYEVVVPAELQSEGDANVIDGLTAAVANTTAAYIPALTIMDFDDISSLPEWEIETYFELAFGVDTGLFSIEDMRRALVTVSSAQSFMQYFATQFVPYNAPNGFVFTNGAHFGGVGWTASAPTLLESIAGIWRIGVDHLTRDAAGTFLAINANPSIRNMIATGVAAVAIERAVTDTLRSAGLVLVGGGTVAKVIGAGVVTVVIGVSLAATQAIFNRQVSDAYLQMINNHRLMMRINYQLNVNHLTGLQTVSRTVNTFTPSEISPGVFLIPCPSINGNSGTWRTNGLVART